jgi:hypothetical protein
MKLSKTQMEAILSPVKAPPETFISLPVQAALVKAGNLGTYVATSFVLPPNYLDWKRCLNKKASENSTTPPSCHKIATSLAYYNLHYSKKKGRKRL